jgi:hypothetical protein
VASITSMQTMDKVQRALLGYGDMLNVQSDAALGCLAALRLQATEEIWNNYQGFMKKCINILEKNLTRDGGTECANDADCYTMCNRETKTCDAYQEYIGA